MPLNCAQLVLYACQIAKCPGFTSQAGDLLQMNLDQLARAHDWDILKKVETLAVNASGTNLTPYAVAADYLRTKEVFYTVDGVVFYLQQLPLEQFDQLFQGTGVSNYPQNFAIDIGTTPANMYFYPPPAFALSVTHRYYHLPAAVPNIASSSTVPWFPETRYLLSALAADLMMLTDDERRPQFLAEAEALLDKYIPLSDDDEGFARQVTLDGRRFNMGSNGVAPTKQTGPF